MFAQFTVRPIATMFAAAVCSTMCLAAATTPVRAAETRSVLVQTADLQLGTTAGRHTLAIRINRAADLACDVGENRDLASITAFRKCVRAAVAAAQPRVLALTVPASLPSS